jgi:Nuclease-related domain
MKIIIDLPTLQRRARLSHAASLGGLLVMLGSVAISLWQPSWSILTSILLFVGFATAVIGIYYANRWVKKPRPEDVLNQALKGLSDQHRLYHYALPCDHVLLTPNGLVVIETVGLEGKFTYQNERWHQKMSLTRAMRFFVEERLGNPILEGQQCAQNLDQHFETALPDVQIPKTKVIVVFTHPYAQLDVKSPAIPICEPKKLRSYLPKNQPKLAPEIFQKIQFELDNISHLTDSSSS